MTDSTQFDWDVLERDYKHWQKAIDEGSVFTADYIFERLMPALLDAFPAIARVAKAAREFDRIIHQVEDRCMAADGPVTPTLKEITEGELRELWLATEDIRNATALNKQAITAGTALKGNESR